MSKIFLNVTAASDTDSNDNTVPCTPDDLVEGEDKVITDTVNFCANKFELPNDAEHIVADIEKEIDILVPAPAKPKTFVEVPYQHFASKDENFEEIREEMHYKIDMSVTKSSARLLGEKGHPDSSKSPRVRQLKRPSFNWPWHTIYYQMSQEFENPNFRSRFVSKILVLKTIQWLLVSSWCISLNAWPHLRTDVQEYGIWGLYGATLAINSIIQ